MTCRQMAVRKLSSQMIHRPVCGTRQRVYAVLAAALGFALLPTTSVQADLIAVSHATSSEVYVFDYDTTTDVLSYVTNVTQALGGNNSALAAVPGYGFIASDQGDGVEKFVTSDQQSWTSELFIDIKGESGPDEFYDGRTVWNIYYVAAAPLKDGTIFVAHNYPFPNANSDNFGIGNIDGLTGTQTAVFTGTLGLLTNEWGNQSIDVTSTIEGASDRFVYSGTGSLDPDVYRSDGSFKGKLTRISNILHGHGNFKSADKGDLILQVGFTAGGSPSPWKFNARSVADADFDTQTFEKIGSHDSLVSVGDKGFIFNGGTADIDGTESGLIVVACGGTRRLEASGSSDGPGVQFFETSDGGSTWTAKTADPIRLDEA